MGEVKNCLLPDDLLYHIEFNVWIRCNDDGTIEIGFTDIAQTMAGSVIHCMPKKVGKTIKKGKSLATVESGKWVGPVKSPFSGEIVAVNGNGCPGKRRWTTYPGESGIRSMPEDRITSSIMSEGRVTKATQSVCFRRGAWTVITRTPISVPPAPVWVTLSGKCSTGLLPITQTQRRYC
ncbi:MAG: glycine cleavage system protein H [Candidatus Marinimicrobia bacterium]|nr:glycine cleavage system protein H [Candidatus Neomarinimicrobiota bacterium]